MKRNKTDQGAKSGGDGGKLYQEFLCNLEIPCRRRGLAHIGRLGTSRGEESPICPGTSLFRNPFTERGTNMDQFIKLIFVVIRQGYLMMMITQRQSQVEQAAIFSKIESTASVMTVLNKNVCCFIFCFWRIEILGSGTVHAADFLNIPNLLLFVD